MHSIKIGKQFFLVLLLILFFNLDLAYSQIGCSASSNIQRCEPCHNGQQFCSTANPDSGVRNGSCKKACVTLAPAGYMAPQQQIQSTSTLSQTSSQNQRGDNATAYDRSGNRDVTKAPNQPQPVKKPPTKNLTPGYNFNCGNGAEKNPDITDNTNSKPCVCSVTKTPVGSGISCDEQPAKSKGCMSPATQTFNVSKVGLDCKCPAQFGGKEVSFGESCGEQTMTVQCLDNEIISKTVSGESTLCICSSSFGFSEQDGRCVKKNSANFCGNGEQPSLNHCQCTGANMSLDQDSKCYCGGENSESFVWNQSSGQCIVKSQDANNFQCSALKDYEQKANSCKSEGVVAVQKCDPKNTDNSGQQMIQMMSQATQAKGQQSGSAETCFKAGVIGTAAWQGLDLLKTDSCEPHISECKSLCEIDQTIFGKAFDSCYREFATLNSNATQDQLSAYAEVLNSKLKSAKATFDQGIQSCSVEAPAKEMDMKKMMTDVNRSAQQAAKCECQLTAGQTSCDQIKGPADCKLNPTDPLCPKTVVMKCAGADKDTKECVCLRDPKGATCATNPTGPAQIAGLQPFNPINSGASNITGGGVGSGSGLGDLNSDAISAKMSGDKSAAAESPFGAAAGGTGSGSGGGSGSGDDNGSAGVENTPEPKSSIGGFFGQLKSGIANAIGGGSKPSALKKFRDKNGNPTDIDPNQWRPKSGLRGIANDGIGRRNMDIFKMINIQYMNQHKTLMSAQDK